MEVASSVSSLTSNIETQHESVDMLSNLYCSDCSNSNSNDSEIINMLELNEIREIIEAMSKFNQVEILKIFCKDKSIIINENKYGIHINLTEISKEIVDELKSYINYVNTQEIQLHKIEKQKEIPKVDKITKP